MEYIYITLSKFNNKFTWALDRDILCMVTKISILTDFLPYFANIIGLRLTKNMNFFQHLSIHIPNNIYYRNHLNDCIPVLQMANYWSSDQIFSFLGMAQPVIQHFMLVYSWPPVLECSDLEYKTGSHCIGHWFYDLICFCIFLSHMSHQEQWIVILLHWARITKASTPMREGMKY